METACLNRAQNAKKKKIQIYELNLKSQFKNLSTLAQ